MRGEKIITFAFRFNEKHRKKLLFCNMSKQVTGLPPEGAILLA